jgi:hypothetical protein
MPLPTRPLPAEEDELEDEYPKTRPAAKRQKRRRCPLCRCFVPGGAEGVIASSSQTDVESEG